ncbi:MAG TPA: DEAD/DEAH box helicase, partial [Phycicoccus sp.]|nr:DEAD/DEAH box helicase [Phycicoccus sp.]
MTALEEFAATLPYALDEFQVDACTAVEDGRGVLVAAPTGAGKTVVGEFAVELALRTGRKAFYTTPIKALSNQKYHDLVARHGAERVGLLTGDVSIRGEAPVVVMTTEVLRNMVYAGSATLAGLGFVVMDEVHYLADKFRGAVWEEVIIHLPESVQVVSLSATVSNAEEFGDWLTQVRGNTAVVVSEHRPVPLWQHLLVGDTLFDLFAGDSGQVIGGDRGPVRINPEVIAAIRRQQTRPRDGREFRRGGGQDRVRGRGRDAAGGSGRTVGERPARASRADIARSLDRDGLLPAITFIFSRAGCDGAVKSLLGAGVRLIPERDGQRNRRVLEERVGQLSDAELDILGYWDVADGLDRGFAAHHAGMLPLFREVVEELFTAGRIRAVYATETLALGINMPARTVVLEKLVK